MENLLLMYFSGYMGGCSGWLNCSGNMSEIPKRFTATVCNFIYNLLNLLRNPAFNEEVGGRLRKNREAALPSHIHKRFIF